VPKKSSKAVNVKEYPIGTRIELELMTDFPKKMPKGLRGTVIGNEGKALSMDWDNNSFFLLWPDMDLFRKLTPEEIADELSEQKTGEIELE